MNPGRKRFIFVLAASMLCAQFKKPLTADDLAQMKKAGFTEETIIRAIAANGASLDTSAQGLIALKSGGLSDAVISAVLSVAGGTPNGGVSATTPPRTGGIPNEIGIYLVGTSAVTPLPVEIASSKTGNVFGTMFTYGIKKMQLKATVAGTKSPFQTVAPLEIMIRCAEGIAPEEYPLVELEIAKDHRELTVAKVGSLGSSLGTKGIEMKIEKLSPNIYRGMVTGLKRGEYGILSENFMKTGKLYTLGIN